jgi:hypothetical protein
VSDDPWLGWIVVPPDIEDKLRTKHRLTSAHVREAVCWGAHDVAAWEDHPVYGVRLVVSGTTVETGPIIVYLRPVDAEDGTWECLTAWRLR